VRRFEGPRRPQADPHTPIAAGLEQLVMLTRVPFRYRDGGNYRTSADYGAMA